MYEAAQASEAAKPEGEGEAKSEDSDKKDEAKKSPKDDASVEEGEVVEE